MYVDFSVISHPNKTADDDEYSDLWMKAVICDKKTMRSHDDVFGNFIHIRQGEVYYSLLYPSGECEWIRSELCSMSLIQEYEKFQIGVLKDCDSAPAAVSLRRRLFDSDS